MLNIVSLVIGLVAAVIALIGLVPLLGWLNWFMLPVAFIGLVVGLLADGNLGRNLCIAVIVVGVLRLMLGGGFI